MINHARSLILNRQAEGRPELGTFGEEYIPEGYRQLDYTGYLDRIRTALLGSAEDPLYQNYRLMQYMDVMHANQYTEEYLLGLDTRYTYRPFKKTFMDFDFSVEVEKLNVTSMTLTTSGEPVVNETTGEALYRCMVRTAAGPKIAVRMAKGTAWNYYDVTLVGEDATPVTLENGVILQLSVPLGGWQVDADWLVTSMARPTRDLGLTIEVVNGLGAGATVGLFRDAPETYRNLWYEGASLVDQLGGILGAFAYKAEEVRLNV